MSEQSMKKTFSKEVRIPKKRMEFWKNVLSKERIDYSEYGWGKYETVFLETVKFEDGYEIELKVNTNTIDDGGLYTEAVLFDSNGYQEACTEPGIFLDGEWCLGRTDENGNEIIYRIDVASENPSWRNVAQAVYYSHLERK